MDFVQGVSVREGLCQGGGLCQGESMSGGSLCPGGLCPVGPCPVGVPVNEGLSPGVSVQGVSVWRPSGIRKVGGRHHPYLVVIRI